jgi:hypothetical protein
MKSLLVLLALTLTTSAFARDNIRDGRLVTNSGGTIIRIEVGNERDTDSRATMKRMVQLERAVRELQNRVYDLEDDARPQTREQKVVTCALRTSFNGTFIGKATTKLEAQSIAIQQCERAQASFCDFNLSQRLTCEESIEVVRN